MDRLTNNRKCATKLYVCENHKFEVITKLKTFSFESKSVTCSYKLTVPSAAGRKSIESEPTSLSKGIGRDRAMLRSLVFANKMKDDKTNHGFVVEDWEKCLQTLEKIKPKTVKEKIENLEEQNLIKDALLEQEKTNTIDASLALLQMAVTTFDDKNININPSLEHACGLPSCKGNAETVRVNKRYFFHHDQKHRQIRKYASGNKPKVNLGMTDKEIKRRTGYPNEKALLTYIFIICNGDMSIIKQRQTSLTWYEEWFMHFEYIWSRSLTRISDLSSQETGFGIGDRYIRDVISCKYDIEWRALHSWPIYASYNEDKSLRNKDKWNKKI